MSAHHVQIQLSKLQEVLSLTNEEAEYELAAETTYYWRTTTLSAIDDAIARTKSPDKVWSIIKTRQKELYLQELSMKGLMTSLVMQSLGRPLEKTNSFARVSNAAATYDGLID